MDVIENAHNGFIFETDEELLSILVNLNQNKSLIQKCANNAFENRALFKWNTLSNQYQKFVLESMTGEHI
jgi:hypothetical protein